ncbi:MAG: hypothetical protein JW841_07830 [Deltaproteobacteria bacterium]|nr:hypothetical protein [Deltaproteobacteria bacterium]
MKTLLRILSLPLLKISIILTIWKPATEIATTLLKSSSDWKNIALVLHLCAFLIFPLGFLIKQWRKWLWGGLVLLVQISTTMIAIFYGMIPTIIFFAMLSILTFKALLQNNLNFSGKNWDRTSFILCIFFIAFSLAYPHWIEPVSLSNILLFSPLGLANCPTLLFTCGFMILADNCRPKFLSFLVAFLTIYFGFFWHITTKCIYRCGSNYCRI